MTEIELTDVLDVFGVEAGEPDCKRVAVDTGLAGMDPSAPAPFLAMVHLLFASVEAFQDGRWRWALPLALGE